MTLVRRGKALISLALAMGVVVISPVLVSRTQAGGLTNCGSFRWEGKAVKVKATGLDCDRARHVMGKLWNGSRPEGWDCDGPQTGYASCERGDKRIVARLQY
jgi:hypothetical protein